MAPTPSHITSLQNDRVKALVRLRTARERRNRGLMIVEEPLVIQRAEVADLKFTEIWFCPEQEAASTTALRTRLADSALEVFEVPAHVMDKIAYRENAEGLLAVSPIPTFGLNDLELPVDRPPLLVVLENLEKPGNLGAVQRVADGAGVHAVIVCGGGTDLFNPNVMRASRGAFFSVPSVAASTDVVQEFLKSKGIAAVATSPVADHRWDEIGMTGPTAILLGTEHEGLSADWLSRADLTVGIPMLGTGDSLNVSTSAAVLLYEAVRQRSLRKAE